MTEVGVPHYGWDVLRGRGESECPRPLERAGTTAPSSRTSGALVTFLITTLWLSAGCGQKQSDPTRRDPGLLTIATQPPPPAAVQPQTGPGGNDFEEGRKLMTQHRVSEALPFLARAAAAEPSNALYQSVYGQALWESGSKDEALTYYNRAAQLSPGSYRLQLARALDAAGKSTEAMNELQGILAVEPSNASAAEDLGRALYRSGDYSRAAPLLRRAADARADDPALLQELAYALEQSGQSAQALEAYRRVLRLAPQADVARGRLAEVLFQEGKKDEAIAITQEGLQQTPDVPILHRNLGNLFERAGRTAEAVNEYKAYARLAPNAPDVKEIIERANRLGGGS